MVDEAGLICFSVSLCELPIRRHHLQVYHYEFQCLNSIIRETIRKHLKKLKKLKEMKKEKYLFTGPINIVDRSN